MLFFNLIFSLFYKITNLKSDEEIQNYLSGIDDPIIKNMSFKYVYQTGNIFSTHSLYEDKYGNLILKYSLLPLYIFFVPIMAFIIMVNYFQDGDSFTSAGFILTNLIVTVPFLLIFIPLMGKSLSKIFDFENGYMYSYISHKNIKKTLNNEILRHGLTPLDSIHAIQIIGKNLSTGFHTFQSYELNIISKKGNRLNLLDNSNLKNIQVIAQSISNKTGMKIYDITK